MYYKMIKYYNASDLDEIKRLNSGIRKLKKDVEKYRDRATKAENMIYGYENYKSYNDGIDDFDFKKAVEAEKKKYLENIKAKKERYI